MGTARVRSPRNQGGEKEGNTPMTSVATRDPLAGLGCDVVRRPRGLGFERVGERGVGVTSVCLKERLRRFEAICWRQFEIGFDRLRGAFAALDVGFKIAWRSRGLGRLAQYEEIVFHRLCRHVALGRSDGLDLLAQHTEAAIAQKFATSAEHRRGGQRDQPAPIKAWERPLDGDAGEGLPLANHAGQLVAASQPGAAEKSLDRLAAMGRLGPNRGDEHGMRRPKAALLVERPQEARIRRRIGQMRRPLFAQIRRRGILPLRSFAIFGGFGRLVACGAQSRN